MKNIFCLLILLAFWFASSAQAQEALLERSSLAELPTYEESETLQIGSFSFGEEEAPWGKPLVSMRLLQEGRFVCEVVDPKVIILPQRFYQSRLEYEYVANTISYSGFCEDDTVLIYHKYTDGSVNNSNYLRSFRNISNWNTKTMVVEVLGAGDYLKGQAIKILIAK